jgi:hypothetical protein
MIVEKHLVSKLSMAYAVNFFRLPEGLHAVAASEGEDRCLFFRADQPDKMEVVWEKSGGTMSIVNISEKGSFLAVQNFFKGFNSKTAKIVRAERDENGKWTVSDYLFMPYVHRFDVVSVGSVRFFIASTLCDEKDSRDDWSRAGRVWLGRLDENGNCNPETLFGGVTKNHGFFRGAHNGKPVILVTGMEGVFEIEIPVKPEEEWRHKSIFAGEVSEAIFVDLDGDGVDEMVTIEPFHGNRMVIYRDLQGGYEEVYSLPVNFGHVIWGGDILGKPSLLLGYRRDNAPLLLLRKKTGDGWRMEQQTIDEHIGPTNISVNSRGDECLILCSAGKSQEILLYHLR